MFKVGDRVRLKCIFNKGACGTVTETRYDYRPEWYDGKLFMPVRVRRDHESGDGLWFHLYELQLIKEEPKMFEVGKKYQRNGSRIEVIYKTEKGVLVEYTAVANPVEGVVYVGSQHFFSWLQNSNWKEYVEPKVSTTVMTVCKDSRDYIYTNYEDASPVNNIIGKIRITYTEGSGITVDVLEGGDTGTI